MAGRDSYIKPSIPFVGSICGGLMVGMTVLIKGSVDHGCETFKIDFQCDSAPGSEVAFHFRPWYNEGCVVMNSFEGGKWQREERVQEIPFRKGYPFEVHFRVSDISYKVVVDGQHFAEFEHRIPLHKVDTLCISGGVEVESINYLWLVKTT